MTWRKQVTFICDECGTSTSVAESRVADARDAALDWKNTPDEDVCPSCRGAV